MLSFFFLPLISLPFKKLFIYLFICLHRGEGATEDEMVGWHHWLNGHELEQTPRDSKRQGSLACCSLWDHKELDMTEWLNNNTGLSFGIWDLWSSLRHSGPLVAASGIYFPDQGLNLGPLRWELGVLATGHQGSLNLTWVVRLELSFWCNNTKLVDLVF